MSVVIQVLILILCVHEQWSSYNAEYSCETAIVVLRGYCTRDIMYIQQLYDIVLKFIGNYVQYVVKKNLADLTPNYHVFNFILRFKHVDKDK